MSPFINIGKLDFLALATHKCMMNTACSNFLDIEAGAISSNKIESSCKTIHFSSTFTSGQDSMGLSSSISV